MIQLLFTLAFTQMGLVLTLVFETPLRKLVIMGLNKMKQGRGPLVAKTVAGTLFVVFVSSLYSVMKIQKRSMDSGAVNPTDQVLLANHLLEASLMGFSLFFGLMIDRLHYYIKELNHLRTKEKSIKVLEDEVLATRSKDKQLKSEPQTKLKKDRSQADKGASLGEIKNT